MPVRALLNSFTHCYAELRFSSEHRAPFRGMQHPQSDSSPACLTETWDYYCGFSLVHQVCLNVLWITSYQTNTTNATLTFLKQTPGFKRGLILIPFYYCFYLHRVQTGWLRNNIQTELRKRQSSYRAGDFQTYDFLNTLYSVSILDVTSPSKTKKCGVR